VIINQQFSWSPETKISIENMSITYMIVDPFTKRLPPRAYREENMLLGWVF